MTKEEALKVYSEKTIHSFGKKLEDIFKIVKKYHPSFNASVIEKITRAFWFAAVAHADQKRFSGEPYFIHCIGATENLLTIYPDTSTICACLMHDVIEDTNIDPKIIENEFSADVRFLCEGVAKVSKVYLKGKDRESESLKKLFLAMAQDTRVIFIKLSDRIHNLSTLSHVRAEKQERIARESLLIYAPIAAKLGLYEFRCRIEDLAFACLEPDAFRIVSEGVEKDSKYRKKMIDMGIKNISKVFEDEKVQCIDIVGRTKNLYGIWEKMKRKNISRVSDVYDLYGIKILVGREADCYRVLGILHAHWKPIPKRFKDYISIPKVNGYQSLHTTLLGLNLSSYPTEVQIKTVEMNMDAEIGPAAHWAYKEVKGSAFTKDYLEKIKTFPEDILGTKSQVKKSDFFLQKVSFELNKKYIHVFTPQGDIKTLPEKSTPIDLAFLVHTSIGSCCVGAKINGIIKPLDYLLKNGDVVEILVKKGRLPNPLWLNFVQTYGAKQKIRSILRKEKNLTWRSDDPKNPNKIIPEKDKKEKKVPTSPSTVKSTSQKNENYSILIGGQKGVFYELSTQCCKPTPSSSIVAYSKKGSAGYMIHDINCREVAHLDQTRLMEACFVLQKKIEVRGRDRKFFFEEMSRVFSRHDLFIWDIKFKRLKNNFFVWSVVVNVNSPKEMPLLIKNLQEINGVISACEVELIRKTKPRKTAKRR